MKIRNLTKKALFAGLVSAATAVAASESGRQLLKDAHAAGMDAVAERRKQREKNTER